MNERLSAPIPKLIIPSTTGTVSRRRLFRMLDHAAARYQCVWLQGPPGAGKTTLAAAYAKASGRPTLWYRLDAADSDPAAFFDYFRQAARRSFRRRGRIPDFGPEYLGGLEAFARMFFRATLPARGTRRRALIVFDDCHAITDNASLSALLARIGDEIPPDTLCLFLSRSGPPPAFAGQVSRGKLFAPPASVLQFDEAETRLLARSSGAPNDTDRLAAARTATGGWAAALAILLREGASVYAVRQGLDDLAAEAWRMLPVSAHSPLLTTSVLETITAREAAALAGSDEAAGIFTQLAADNYLVSQVDRPSPAWRVHPLLRTYLLVRAREQFGEAGLRELQRRGAALARDAGRLEEAAALYIGATDWAGLRALALGAARDYLASGRHLLLLDWLSALPDTERGDPWLRYWESLARMPVDPKSALAGFGCAHRAFGDDPLGQLLSAAGALSAMMFAWDDFSEGPRWLAELVRLDPFRESVANPEIDAFVIASGNAGLVFDLGNPILSRWARQAERILPQASPSLQTAIASFLVHYHCWRGELSACRSLLHALRDDYPDAGPLFAVTRHVWSAVIGFLSADHEAAGAAITAAHKLAGQYGLGFYLPQIFGQETYTALSQGDLPRAAHAIDAMAAVTLPGRRLDVAFRHHVRSGLLLARGQYAEARYEAELAVSLSEECSTSTNAHLVMICLAQILIRQGDQGEAERWLDRVEAFCVANNAPLVRYVAQMSRADGLLSRGEMDAAAAVLADALPAARRNDWYNIHPFWQPEPVARLCQLALQRGIECDYVRRLIRMRKLPAPADADETWPWQVRIYALGPLEVFIGDTRLDFPVRAQGKPLELLRCLIAHGADHVPAETLAEALWPDADGDRALAALKTTQQRLRNLIGHGALVQREGRLALNAREVWLDVRAFDRLLRESGNGLDIATLERALDLYKGQLLSDDEADAREIPARQRLHAAYIAGVERLCTALIAAGREVEALQRYRMAIATDPLSEILHRRYLKLCLRLGLDCDALQAFRDYELRLKTRLGITPSPELHALITARTDRGQA